MSRQGLKMRPEICTISLFFYKEDKTEISGFISPYVGNSNEFWESKWVVGPTGLDNQLIQYELEEGHTI